MKQKISKLIGDCHIVKQIAENIRPLNLIQDFLYAYLEVLSKRNSRGAKKMSTISVEKINNLTEEIDTLEIDTLEGIVNFLQKRNRLYSKYYFQRLHFKMFSY